MARILLILTGGTICCQKEDGVMSSCTQVAERMLVTNFRAGSSPWREAEIEARFPLDTLSENMTVEYWQRLLEELRGVDFSAWDGIIMAHGTDTLGFSAALLDAALAGAPIPLILVSSQYPLADPRANGNDNFRAAVELICEHKLPSGVWAVYRNADGVIWLHRGRELRQCAVKSDDFISAGAMDVAEVKGPLPAEAPPHSLPLTVLEQAGPLTNCVLFLQPYVGLDYSRLSLTGLKAVVHSVYHSGTVCTGRKSPDQPYGANSLLYLADRCRERGIPLFVGPSVAGTESDQYSTMADFASCGAVAVPDATPETIYAKALLGCALGYEGEELVSFVCP